VAVSAVFLDKDGTLVEIQLDHGTISAIGGDSISISEAGGSTVTVDTDENTVVHLGREKGSLDDLAVGDEIYVHSRVDGGTALAKHILKKPADAST